MKRTLFIAIMALAVGTVFAQEGIRFGIKGGLNLASVSTEKSADILKSNLIPSFNAGMFLDMPIAGEFISLQPGIFYTGKGNSFKLMSSGLLDTDVSVNTRSYYVEGQANLIFKIPLESFKIFVGAGPYVAYGTNGTVEIKGKVFGENISEKEKIEFSTDDKINFDDIGYYKYMKPWDFGVNITAGVEISGLILSANYGLGLTNIRPGAENSTSPFVDQLLDGSGKNRVLNVSVGVLF